MCKLFHRECFYVTGTHLPGGYQERSRLIHGRFGFLKIILSSQDLTFNEREDKDEEVLIFIKNQCFLKVTSFFPNKRCMKVLA